jgi:FAD/FMN-containing dehydrogenase
MKEVREMQQINHPDRQYTSALRPALIDDLKNKNTTANDIHSKLNSTKHKAIIKVLSGNEVQTLLTSEQHAGDSFSIAGGRHSMGGQQFLFDGILIDTGLLNKVVDFCPVEGLITVQSGMLWGDLVGELAKLNVEHGCDWSIIQKPTGADDISIGGSLGSNIHGRVLGRKPFIADIERFTAILENGQRINVSRFENKELFRLAIGGYGMFCFVENITIRLVKSTKLQRRVELTNSKELVCRFEQLQAEGATYGDFQFCIDADTQTFLCNGILSAYFPVDVATTDDVGGLKLNVSDWRELLRLAHIDKTRAFKMYSEHYTRTNGQIYSSQTFQLSLYVPDYHDSLDSECHVKGSEMITELYVPKSKLHVFMETAKAALKKQRADVIYGTVRFIDKDEESFLAWAKDDFACIIFNLHVNPDQLSLLRAKTSFRSLIDIALSLGGSYYLTYHRYATKEQVLAAYPQFGSFIEKKMEYDPQGKFRSTWFNQMCLAFEPV